MNYNRVILAGRLTRDPEVRFTASNTAVCKFGIAVNRRYKAGDEWKESVTFVDVTIFGKRGEAFEQHHKKGSEAFLEGRIETDTWDDKTSGQKRTKTYVIADSWEFVGGKEQREAPADEPRQRGRKGGYVSDTPGVDFDPDDTPF